MQMRLSLTAKSASAATAPRKLWKSWCDVLNPAVMADGQTCDNYDLHSLRLFNFAGSEFYTTVEGRVANHYDGTKTYTVTVVSTEDANAGWDLELNYGAFMTWQEWIDQPGAQSYKSDCGLGDHTTWMYTTLESGSAEGWGNYAGSSLSFTHQPASGYLLPARRRREQQERQLRVQPVDVLHGHVWRRGCQRLG